MAVVMRDVSRKAGVSLKTVSRVINNEGYVAPETRALVLEAIRELGYVPNQAARNLSRGKAMAVGLVLGWGFIGAWSSSLVEPILIESKNRGYNLSIFSKVQDVANQVKQASLGKHVDGFILDTIAAENVALRKQLEIMRLPYVIIHPGNMHGIESTSYVTIDDYQSAKSAVDYLIDLGHRIIGYIGSAKKRIPEQMRLKGYLDALTESGISDRKNYIINDDSSAYAVGYSGMKKLLINNKELTAVFCGTDEMAMGAMSAVFQSGLKVPDDISLVGFDDIRYASMIIPPLTTVHQPFDKLAIVAVEQLIKMINDPEAEILHMQLPTTLVTRGSCMSL